MTRIFSSLAVFAVIVLGVNLVLGLSIGPFNEVAQELRDAQQDAARRQLLGSARNDPEWQAARDRTERLLVEVQPLRRRASLHKLAGIAAALITLLVNSVAITYFVGTSRWCKEVSDAYHLDPQRVEQCRRLKRRTFASAALSMALVVVLSGLGAAADPGNSLSGSQQLAVWHLNAALAGVVVISGLFWYQVGKVSANYELIQSIMRDVRQVRDQHGLDQAVSR